MRSDRHQRAVGGAMASTRMSMPNWRMRCAIAACVNPRSSTKCSLAACTGTRIAPLASSGPCESSVTSKRLRSCAQHPGSSAARWRAGGNRPRGFMQPPAMRLCRARRGSGCTVGQLRAARRGAPPSAARPDRLRIPRAERGMVSAGRSAGGGRSPRAASPARLARGAPAAGLALEEHQLRARAASSLLPRPSASAVRAHSAASAFMPCP